MSITRLPVRGGGEEEAGAELGQRHHDLIDQIPPTTISSAFFLHEDGTPNDVLHLGEEALYVSGALVQTLTDLGQSFWSLVELLNTFGDFPWSSLCDAHRDEFLLSELHKFLSET